MSCNRWIQGAVRLDVNTVKQSVLAFEDLLDIELAALRWSFILEWGKEVAQSTCEKCGEWRRVRTSVISGSSEAAPKPVWTYHCNICQHEWQVDENKGEGSAE